ncbi:MAG: hypothetical protein AAFN43_08035 [Pseudomonadota bacterium]
MSRSGKMSLVAASALLLSSLATTGSAFAEAGYGSVLRANSAGKQACNTLEARGGTYWEAKVRGSFDDYDRSFSNLNLTRFNVRSCFTTQAKCENFINRIEHRIYPVERISYARCSVES